MRKANLDQSATQLSKRASPMIRLIITLGLIILAPLTTAMATHATTIPPEIKKTVTFIFLADKEGRLKIDTSTKRPVAIGTGFFVIVDEQQLNKKTHFSYLVTAKHVMQDPAGGIYTRIFVRLNKLGGDSEFIPIDLLKQKMFTSDDSSVDIAVIPLGLNPSVADAKAIPDDMLSAKASFDELHIAEGSDVFFVGLFTSYYGDKRNNPVVRFGRVAMLPDERISFGQSGKEWLYLIETQTYGGNSGAPVFFSLGPDRNPDALVIGPPDIKLAGIMKGFFNQRTPVELATTVQTNAPQTIPVAVLNSGIAAITPAYLLHDILFSAEVKQLRIDACAKKGTKPI